jgi:hypothetical protein
MKCPIKANLKAYFPEEFWKRYDAGELAKLSVDSERMV